MRWVCLLLLSAALLAGCGETSAPPPAAAPEAVMTFDVKGMTCEGCQQTVTEAIAGVEGVTSVNVSLEENKATVTVDASRAPTPDTIAAAVKESGYEAVDAK